MSNLSMIISQSRSPSPWFWPTQICDQILTALVFRKQPIEPHINMEQEFIEISSDEESKDEEKNKKIFLKKRTLSNSAAAGPLANDELLSTQPQSKF